MRNGIRALPRKQNFPVVYQERMGRQSPSRRPPERFPEQRALRPAHGGSRGRSQPLQSRLNSASRIRDRSRYVPYFSALGHGRVQWDWMAAGRVASAPRSNSPPRHLGVIRDGFMRIGWILSAFSLGYRFFAPLGRISRRLACGAFTAIPPQKMVIPPLFTIAGLKLPTNAPRLILPPVSSFGLEFNVASIPLFWRNSNESCLFE